MSQLWQDLLPIAVAILFIVMGVVLLVAGARQWVKAQDEDSAPPQWLAEIESFTPGRAGKLGLAWLFISPKQWLFVLTAVATIYATGMSPQTSLSV